MSESIEAKTIEKLRNDLTQEREVLTRLRREFGQARAQVTYYENALIKVREASTKAFDRYEKLVDSTLEQAIPLILDSEKRDELLREEREEAGNSGTDEEILWSCLRPFRIQEEQAATVTQ